MGIQEHDPSHSVTGGGQPIAHDQQDSQGVVSPVATDVDMFIILAEYRDLSEDSRMADMTSWIDDQDFLTTDTYSSGLCISSALYIGI